MHRYFEIMYPRWAEDASIGYRDSLDEAREYAKRFIASKRVDGTWDKESHVDIFEHVNMGDLDGGWTVVASRHVDKII